jgi:N-acetylglutamate synthase-like GNAT family acetyltransferase
MFEIRAIEPKDRQAVITFLMEQWCATQMILRGERVDLSNAPGWIAWEDGMLIGLVTIRQTSSECEILSMNSLRENIGVGTALINCVLEAARKEGAGKVILITTNDNIHAIRFYQKRGFDMVRINRNALDISRKLKPAIPLAGLYGIPLKHEIEFEIVL